MSSLHPAVRQLVATLPKPPAAPWDVPITAYREAGERLALLAGSPDDGCAVTELAIPVRRGSVDARHYRPPGETACPAVVYLHGGGFVRGSLDSHDRLCRALCVRGGLGVVAVAYRLAPENRFPAAHEDALDALRWVSEHAGELSIDATALAVAGDSSGGTLAAATALAARGTGPPLKAQGLLCPALDTTMSSGSVDRYHAGPFLTREGLAWSYDQYVPDADDRRSAQVSSLLEENLADAPPAVIISAEIDPVADDARRYAEALAAAGVAVETHEYAGMPHGFMLLAGMLDDGDHALTTFARGLAELLRSEHISRLVGHSGTAVTEAVYPLRDLVATVLDLEEIARDTLRLRLDLPEPLAFDPGQYVELVVPGTGERRQYSLANTADEDKVLELHVRLVPSGAATEGWIFDGLAVGDQVEITGPLGDFVLPTEDDGGPMVLIGGGTGLAPLLGLVRTVLTRDPQREVLLYHGVRGATDLYDLDLLAELADTHPRFSFLPVLSHEPPPDGTAYRTGFPTDLFVDDVASARGWSGWLCGPPAMVEAGVKAFKRRRMAPRLIHREKFTPADAAS